MSATFELRQVRASNGALVALSSFVVRCDRCGKRLGWLPTIDATGREAAGGCSIHRVWCAALCEVYGSRWV